jgi:hypothetical protein
MLPPWMIEEIRRREEEAERAREEQRPRIEIPVPPSDWRPFPESQEPEQTGGRVIIIQY